MNLHLSIFRNIASFLTVGLTILLAACQTTPFYQAYNGPQKPDSEVAVFSIPGSFNMLFIDKEKYNSLSIGDGADIQALPGNHHLIFYFKEYWDLPGDNFERVESKPISVKIDAEAGHHYQLTFNKPKNLEEARAFGKKPSIAFTDLSNQSTTAATIEYNVYTKSFFSDLLDGNSSVPSTTPPGSFDSTGSTQESSQSNMPGAIPVATPTITTSSATSSSNSSESPPAKEDARAMEMLKYWWESASEKQRKDFREWIK